MMLTNRQKQTIKEIKESFVKANKTNGFNYDNHTLYFDPEKNIIILVTTYTRALVNLLDGDTLMTIVDLRGKTTPLSHLMKSFADRLKYLKTLQILKDYE
jgi:hypothetical protein